MKTISGKEFARIVRAHGWTLLRINGIHHIRKRSANHVFTGPYCVGKMAGWNKAMTELAGNHWLGARGVRRSTGAR